MAHKLIEKPYRDGHLKIASSGHARQLIIFGHGGWKASDGSMTVRPNATVYYYVADGVATVGHTLFDDIIKNPGLAFYGGLNKPAEMDQQAAIAAIKGGADPREVMNKTKTLNQPVQQAVAGGQSTSNYAIYHHPDGQSMIDKCKNGEIDDDLDVAINASQHKCHLSDFFDMCQSNSIAYQIVHYVACRVAR